MAVDEVLLLFLLLSSPSPLPPPHSPLILKWFYFERNQSTNWRKSINKQTGNYFIVRVDHWLLMRGYLRGWGVRRRRRRRGRTEKLGNNLRSLRECKNKTKKKHMGGREFSLCLNYNSVKHFLADVVISGGGVLLCRN